MNKIKKTIIKLEIKGNLQNIERMLAKIEEIESLGDVEVTLTVKKTKDIFPEKDNDSKDTD